MAIPTIMLNDARPIPQLGFGVFKIPADETQKAVEKALEVGYRHIDTASAYGNEEAVGKAVAKSGIPREELFLTTKLRNGDRPKPREALEQSIEHLGVDYLDLYLIHWPVPADGLAATIWQVMEAAQTEGIIRSIGVSNFRPEDLLVLRERGTVTPAVNQIECHPTFQNRALATASTADGIAVEAYSPLGQGADLNAEPVMTAAAAHGVSAAQVIIRWHLQHGRIVIPKSNTPERIESNFAVDNFELSDLEVASIDRLDTGTSIGFDPATFDWPQTGPIPQGWKPGMGGNVPS